MKRPDRYRTDPAETEALAYRRHPQTGRGKNSLDDTEELDRRQLAKSDDESQSIPIPARRSAPARHPDRPLRADESEDPDEAEELERKIFPEPGAAQVRSEKENPLV